MSQWTLHHYEQLYQLDVPCLKDTSVDDQYILSIQYSTKDVDEWETHDLQFLLMFRAMFPIDIPFDCTNGSRQFWVIGIDFAGPLI